MSDYTFAEFRTYGTIDFTWTKFLLYFVPNGTACDGSGRINYGFEICSRAN